MEIDRSNESFHVFWGRIPDFYENLFYFQVYVQISNFYTNDIDTITYNVYDKLVS
jgi:hypothetical protein